jgi:hypothetical protein
MHGPGSKIVLDSVALLLIMSGGKLNVNTAQQREHHRLQPAYKLFQEEGRKRH